MLRINVISSSGQAKSYFSDHLAKGDYYARSQNHEVSARWSGKASERMGLLGTVTQADYEALIDHKNPRTNEPLTARKNDNRRVGYDLTFSAPKSLSVYYAHTGDKRVLDSFRDSVQETMREMEAEVKVRVRQHGETRGERVTGNALWSSFLHQETRPVDGKPDPHMHEHVVLHNVTFDKKYQNRDGSEGAWMAAEIGDLKRNAPYYQAAFDARLAAKLSELGLAVRQNEHGSYDLAGFNDQIKQTFSRRTALIEQRAEQLGIEHSESKAQLGARTREAKRGDLSPADLVAEWNSRLTERQWKAFISQAEAGQSALKISPADALDYGLGHTLERQSVARKTDVLAHALQRGVGSVTPEQIHEALSRRKDVISAKVRGQVLLTTDSVIEEEAAMIKFARDGRGTVKPLGSESFQFRPITRGGDTFELNQQQKAAVEHILGSRSKVIIVRGAAGTGKTSMMAEAIRGIAENGGQVHSFAPTAAARDVLQKDGEEAGISSLREANTVAKLLQNNDLQASVRGQTILIDEAGLMSTPDLKRVFDLAKQQKARVLLSGDYKQHSSVSRGDAMRILVSQAGIRPAEVSEIQRQRNEVYKSAVEDFSRGTRTDVTAGFDKLDGMGLIQEVTGRDERNERLANGYLDAVKAGKTALVISPTHAEGAEVTASIRERLKQEGLIGQRDHAVLRLRNLHLTESQRENPDSYSAGQVVQFHKPSKVVASSTMEIETVVGMGPHGPTIHKQFEANSRTTKIGYNWKDQTGLQRDAPVTKGLTYGSRATVLGRDKHGNVQMRTDTGQLVQLPLTEAHKFSVYEQIQQPVAAGDSIRITQNMLSKTKTKKETRHRLSNGAIYRVDGFTRKGDIRLGNGWIIDQKSGHFSQGYVTTSHASQGKTRDIVFVSQSSKSFPASNMAQFYVSVSRAKEATIILTDDKNSLRNQAILRSGERMASTELATKSTEQQTLAAEEERTARQRSYLKRLNDAAHRARDMAQQKAATVKAYYGKLRDRWRNRGDRGMGYEQ